mmetsp:Transcript_6004/g.6896  ORF Transcript_6004/g.6896 Transcript_6004/m.6896 type:complete len:301 (+) Transcript_6004:210-1112(+)
MGNRWTISEVPDLSGKTVVVTGGNTGLGFKSCLEFARNNAEVILACRNKEKGDAAVARIKAEIPDCSVRCMTLDLSDLSSVNDFGKRFCAEYEKLDILMNNAGIVNLATLQRTKEGREMQMATNHLGHFALTFNLLEPLLQSERSRVVILSSGAYRWGKINFEDLDWEEREESYSRVQAYGDSKLANMLFCLGLQDYFDQRGANAISVAAHPGLTGTERQQAEGVGGAFTRWLATSVDKGVESQLRAATDNNVKGKQFYGPKYMLFGPPSNLSISEDAQSQELIQQLWEYSEQATNCKYP